MSSAYGAMPGATGPRVPLPLLPCAVSFKDNSAGVVERLEKTDTDSVDAARWLLNEAIAEGQTYPQLEEMDPPSFAAYFLSHEAFVCRIDGHVAGAFYVKPNFPGRCQHICNGGFVVARASRGKGVARAMAQVFLRVAHLLGYRAVMFNLVFASNIPSLRLWDSLGFTRSGRIPQAGNLKGLGYVDAIQFYKDLTIASEEHPEDNTPKA